MDIYLIFIITKLLHTSIVVEKTHTSHRSASLSGLRSHEKILLTQILLCQMRWWTPIEKMFQRQQSSLQMRSLRKVLIHNFVKAARLTKITLPYIKKHKLGTKIVPLSRPAKPAHSENHRSSNQHSNYATVIENQPPSELSDKLCKHVSENSNILHPLIKLLTMVFDKLNSTLCIP